ncbi:MAG: Hint domain-containing protein [Paracoccaceae bacterium]
MTWLALSYDTMNHTPSWLAPDLPEMVERGAIVVEAQLGDGPEADVPLLDYARDQGWARSFGLTLERSGAFRLRHAQGPGLAASRLAAPGGSPLRDIRLRFSWNAPERIGHLSVENLQDGTVHRSRAENPLPLPAEDIAGLFADIRHHRRHPGVRWYGLNAGTAVPGVAPCFSAAARVRTPEGWQPAGRLRPGDRVLTATGTPVRLLALRRMVLPARGSLTPVRLRAPYFGLAADLVVAPHHLVMVRGDDVEYLFGTPAALVEARHLVDGLTARYDATQPTVTYVSPVLARHDALDVEGCGVASLYLRDKELGALGLDQSVPAHRRAALRVLRRFEAVAYCDLNRR